MKKSIALVSVISALFFLGGCQSGVVPPDECFETSENSDGTIEITKYDFDNEKCGTKITIPEKIGEKTVTSIGNYSFVNDKLKKAFLEDIEFNKKMEDIESKYSIDSIDSIDILKEATNQILQLIYEKKDNIKKDYKLLEYVSIPNSVKQIKYEAFLFNNLGKSYKYGPNTEVSPDAFFLNGDLKYDIENIKKKTKSSKKNITID